MSEKMSELLVGNPNEAVMLLGMSDANLKLIEETFNVQIITRGELIQIAGDVDENKERVTEILRGLLHVIRKGININQRDVATAIEMAQKAQLNILQSFTMKRLPVRRKGK